MHLRDVGSVAMQIYLMFILVPFLLCSFDLLESENIDDCLDLPQLSAPSRNFICRQTLLTLSTFAVISAISTHSNFKTESMLEY